MCSSLLTWPSVSASSSWCSSPRLGWRWWCGSAVPARTLDRLPLRGLWAFVDGCISPGEGIAGSLRKKLFIRLERLRSMVPLSGEADSGARWRPALIVAAACREDIEGERGEGGPGCVTMASVPAREMRRVLWCRGEPEVGVRDVWWRVLMSGDIGMIGRW